MNLAFLFPAEARATHRGEPGRKRAVVSFLTVILRFSGAAGPAPGKGSKWSHILLKI